MVSTQWYATATLAIAMFAGGGCSSESEPAQGGAMIDAASTDAQGFDAHLADASGPGPIDAGIFDARIEDAVVSDAAQPDARAVDAAPGDSGWDGGAVDGGPADARAVDAAGTDAAAVPDSAATDCHGVANGTFPAQVRSQAAAFPAATGGTPYDATFMLENVRRYTGVGGATGDTGERRIGRLRIRGNVFELVLNRGSGDVEWTATATFGAGGTLALDVSCPTGATLPFRFFDFTPGYVQLYDPAANETMAFSPPPS